MNSLFLTKVIDTSKCIKCVEKPGPELEMMMVMLLSSWSTLQGIIPQEPIQSLQHNRSFNSVLWHTLIISRLPASDKCAI